MPLSVTAFLIVYAEMFQIFQDNVFRRNLFLLLSPRQNLFIDNIVIFLCPLEKSYAIQPISRSAPVNVTDISRTFFLKHSDSNDAS